MKQVKEVITGACISLLFAAIIAALAWLGGILFGADVGFRPVFKYAFWICLAALLILDWVVFPIWAYFLSKRWGVSYSQACAFATERVEAGNFRVLVYSREKYESEKAISELSGVLTNAVMGMLGYPGLSGRRRLFRNKNVMMVGFASERRIVEAVLRKQLPGLNVKLMSWTDHLDFSFSGIGFSGEQIDALVVDWRNGIPPVGWFEFRDRIETGLVSKIPPGAKLVYFSDFHTIAVDADKMAGGEQVMYAGRLSAEEVDLPIEQQLGGLFPLLQKLLLPESKEPGTEPAAE